MKQNAVISEMTDQELVDHLGERFQEYRKLRLNHSVSPLENPLLLRSKRREIARLNTEMKKREQQAKKS